MTHKEYKAVERRGAVVIVKLYLLVVRFEIVRCNGGNAFDVSLGSLLVHGQKFHLVQPIRLFVNTRMIAAQPGNSLYLRLLSNPHIRLGNYGLRPGNFTTIPSIINVNSDLAQAFLDFLIKGDFTIIVGCGL